MHQMWKSPFVDTHLLAEVHGQSTALHSRCTAGKSTTCYSLHVMQKKYSISALIGIDLQCSLCEEHSWVIIMCPHMHLCTQHLLGVGLQLCKAQGRKCRLSAWTCPLPELPDPWPKPRTHPGNRVQRKKYFFKACAESVDKLLLQSDWLLQA